MVIASGPYGLGPARLIDDVARRRITIQPPPVCAPWVIGGSSLVYRCATATSTDPSYQVTDLASGVTSPLTISPQGFDPSACSDLAGCTGIDAVGSAWVMVGEDCGTKCSILHFQDLDSGAVSADPSTATSALDLDTASLSRSLCPGVTDPPLDSDPTLVGGLVHGLVIQSGRLAVVSDNRGFWLERCGTHLHRFLTANGTNPSASSAFPAPPVSNAHAVMWQSAAGRLSGLFLPGLRPFTIAISARLDPRLGEYPDVLDDQYHLALTPATLYVSTAGGIWTTPAPRRQG